MTLTETDFEITGPTKKPLIDVLKDEEFEISGPSKVPASAQYAVPQDAEFGSAEFMSDDTLTKMCYELVATKANLAHLKDGATEIDVLWKKKGGSDGGKPAFGKTAKPSGLIRRYCDADFIIWLAADNCRGMSKHEVEATLFRQLCAAGRDEDGNRVIIPPDFKDYVAVIQQYGLISPELRLAGKVIRQLKMDL